MTKKQRANRAKLLRALRDNMPSDFHWNYNVNFIAADIPRSDEHPQCGSIGCAKGLAFVLGITQDVSTLELADAIGLSHNDAVDVFFDGQTYGCGDSWESVTPAMVADEIERRTADKPR